MRMTQATPEAVHRVFDKLWERGEQELAILGIDLEAARAIAINEYGMGAPTLAIWFSGEPVLICGLMRTENPFAMRTWFQATDLFKHHAKTITSKMRDMMAEGARTYNLDYIETVSPCVHPHTGRWFQAMGLELDIDSYPRSRNGQRMYRFVRHFPKGDQDVLRRP